MDKQTFIGTISELLTARQNAETPDNSTSFIVCLNNNTEIHADHFDFEEDEQPVKWVRLYLKDLHNNDNGKQILYPIAVVKLQDINAIFDHSNWC